MKKHKPDFEKMWSEIQLRIAHPIYYMIKHKFTERWLSKPDKDKRRWASGFKYECEKFSGPEAKQNATIWLWFIQEEYGQLLDFEVSEHRWGE